MPYNYSALFYFTYLYFVQCTVIFLHASLLEALSKTNVPPSAKN